MGGGREPRELSRDIRPSKVEEREALERADKKIEEARRARLAAKALRREKRG